VERSGPLCPRGLRRPRLLVASPSGGLDHVSGGLSHRRGPFSSRSAPPDINIVGNRGGPHGTRFHKCVSFVVVVARRFRLKDVDEILRIATYGYRSGLGTAVGGAPCARFLCHKVCQPRKNPKSKVSLYSSKPTHTYSYLLYSTNHTHSNYLCFGFHEKRAAPAGAIR